MGQRPWCGCSTGLGREVGGRDYSLCWGRGAQSSGISGISCDSEGILYLNIQSCLPQTILLRTRHRINKWNFPDEHLYSFIFPLGKNITASGDMDSCRWLVLSLVHVVAGNNREQICLGALHIHCAQQMEKAAELIDRKKWAVPQWLHSIWKEIQANTIPFSFSPRHWIDLRFSYILRRLHFCPFSPLFFFSCYGVEMLQSGLSCF